MNPIRSLMFALSVVAATFAVQALAAEHSHDDHAHHAAQLQLNNGKKWPSDAALRASMTALRAAFAEKLGAIHSGKLDSDGYRALGSKIDGEIANIVAQCKLEPKADAMLHIVIGDLAAGADVMQGRAAGEPMGGAHKAAMALNAYGRHFQHPGWKPLK